MSTILLGIVSRNRVAILPKAIESALAQDVDLDVEVIDDASDDGTPELRERFPEVRWTLRDEVRGYLSARNEMMSEDGYDYFVSLDDDAWFLQNDEVGLAIAHLEANHDVAAVSFDILSPDCPDPVRRGAACQVPTFIGCGHVLRLSATAPLGHYIAPPGSYGGEEKDLSLRLLDSGYRVDLLPGVHVWHDKTSVARILPYQHQSGVCNDLVFAVRRAPLAILPIALAAKIARHLTFSVRRGFLRPCLAGFGVFLRHFPEVWQTRKPVRTATLRKFVQLGKRAN